MFMREEKFKMERQGLIQVGDKVKISEFLSATNYSYIIEPAGSQISPLFAATRTRIRPPCAETF
jgi:hypothetical protein